jgi:hypothetical protein
MENPASSPFDRNQAGDSRMYTRRLAREMKRPNSASRVHDRCAMSDTLPGERLTTCGGEACVRVLHIAPERGAVTSPQSTQSASRAPSHTSCSHAPKLASTGTAAGPVTPSSGLCMLDGTLHWQTNTADGTKAGTGHLRLNNVTHHAALCAMVKHFTPRCAHACLQTHTT